MGGQGSPPGRNPTNVTLNVLVGDAKAGETHFKAACGDVPLGDRRPARASAAKFPDAARASERVGQRLERPLRWRRRARRRWRRAAFPRPSRMADGSKLEGTLVREDDFLVVLMLPDGTRKSMARTDGVPKVDVKDPQAGHMNTIVKLAHEDPTTR